MSKATKVFETQTCLLNIQKFNTGVRGNGYLYFNNMLKGDAMTL